MRRSIRGLAFAGVVVLAAWPAAAGAKTVTVYAGGTAGFQRSLSKKTGGGVDNFLINRVTVNVGDTVVWNGKARAAGFHTIDFPAKGGSDLPLFTPTGKTVSGVNDFAGNPFWFDGKVPEIGFNPGLFAATGGSTYNGASRADSGLPLGKPSNFKLTFTKPGVYKYFCDVHYGMVGYVVVRKAGQPVPSAASNQRTLVREERAYARRAKKLDRTKVAGNNVSVGASAAGGLEVFAMFPSTRTVKVGTTVTFSMSKRTRETHTVTFGPESYLTPLATSLSGPLPAPNALYPSGPPGTISLDQTSHGNGFANTGGLDRDSGTPLPASGQITFTQPGTYHFICLIHPFMHGTVVVTK
jgi:plastocyanin